MQKNEQLRRSLQAHKRRVFGDIREGNSDSVDDGLAVYRELIMTFLDTIEKYQMQYDRELASREGHVLGGRTRTGWEGIDWIRDNYTSFLEAAFNAGHKEVLLSVLYFPYSLATRSIRRGDYYVFQKFVVDQGTYPYTLSRRLGQDELDLVMDRLNRYPKEFVRFHLRQVLRDVASASAISLAVDAAEALVFHIGDLMKEALNRGDIEEFERFRDTLMSFHLRRWWDVDDHRGWVTQKRVLSNAEMRESYDESTLQFHRKLEDTIETLETDQRLVLFGLSAWIIRSFTSESRDAEETSRWLETAGPIGNMSRVLSTYGKALRFETHDRIGWDRWMMEELPEDTVGTIDPSQYLHFVPIYYGASELPMDGEQGILPDDIELARLISDSAKADGGLRQAIQAVRDENERWEQLFEEPASVVASRFEELCERLTEEYEELWTEKVRLGDVSEDRVEAFRSGLEKKYRAKRAMAGVFEELDGFALVEEDDETVDRSRWYGHSQLLPKEYFVSESRLLIEPLGEQYGEQLARGEQDRVLAAMLDSEIPIREVEQDADAVGVLKEVLKAVAGKKRQSAVLLFNCWWMYRPLEMEGLLKNRELGGAADAYIGTFRGTKVYRLHSQKQQGALVGNISKLGTWAQYRPCPLEDRDEKLLAGLVRFSLRQVGVEKAREIVEQSEDFGDDEPLEDAVQRLVQQRLHLSSGTRAEWRTGDSEAARWIECPGR